jgi:hypothetical protein
VCCKSVLTLDFKSVLTLDFFAHLRLASVWAGMRRTQCAAGACAPGDEFGDGESIFSIPHTNEFVGMHKRAPEPTAACCGVNPCRRDYEREEKKKMQSAKKRAAAVGITGAFGRAATADASLRGL